MNRINKLKDYIIFHIDSFYVMGLYSKNANTKIKRILHYFPILVLKKKRSTKDEV